LLSVWTDRLRKRGRGGEGRFLHVFLHESRKREKKKEEKGGKINEEAMKRLQQIAPLSYVNTKRQPRKRGGRGGERVRISDTILTTILKSLGEEGKRKEKILSENPRKVTEWRRENGERSGKLNS